MMCGVVWCVNGLNKTKTIIFMYAVHEYFINNIHIIVFIKSY
jgi:hypothetical protein